MKVETEKQIRRSLQPKTIILTVDDPISHKILHRVTISREEAEEAIEYLRAHNGKAPRFVHGFIDAMEFALSLRV